MLQVQSQTLSQMPLHQMVMLFTGLPCKNGQPGVAQCWSTISLYNWSTTHLESLWLWAQKADPNLVIKMGMSSACSACLAEFAAVWVCSCDDPSTALSSLHIALSVTCSCFTCDIILWGASWQVTCLHVLVLLLLDCALFNMTHHVSMLLCMHATACSAFCKPLYSFRLCVLCQ